MSWVHPLLVVGLDNALGAALLAGVVFLITRCWRNPLVAHALWLLVLVKLVAPPVVPLHWGMSSASLLPTAPLEAPRLPEDLPRLPVRVAVEHTISAAPVAPLPDRSLPAVEPLRLPAREVSQEPEPVVEPEVASVATPISPPTNSTAEPLAVSRETPPAPAVDGPPISRSWSWPLAALALWLAGIAAYLAIATTRIVRFHRALGQMPLADERVARLAAQAAAQMGYAGKLIVRVSAGNTAPSLWAVGRPTILLPQELAASLADDELSGILAHETAHLVRRDPWVRWFELAVVALYWWHPAAWWARRELRDAEELACDALILERVATEPDAYVRGLLRALEISSGSAGPSLASGLGGKGTLQRRVEAMLARRYGSRLSWVAAMAVGLVALAFVPLSMRANPVQDTPAAAATPEAAIAEQAKAPAVQAHADGPDVAKATKPPLDPRLGPGRWVDPQVREYLRNYMLRPEWGEANVVIKGRVIDERGEPVAEADMSAQTQLFGTIAVTRSDAQGEFEVRLASRGFPEHPALIARHGQPQKLGMYQIPAVPADRPPQPYTVVLERPREVEAKVLDANGEPIADATTIVMYGDGLADLATTDAQGVANFAIPRSAPIMFVMARKDGQGMAYQVFEDDAPLADHASATLTLVGARTVRVRALDGRTGQPLAGVMATPQVVHEPEGRREVLRDMAESWKIIGSDGVAEFDAVPKDEELFVRMRSLDEKLHASSPDNGNNFEAHVHFDPRRTGNERTVEFWPYVTIAGQVRFPDGRPAAQMPVRYSERGQTTTDDSGRFQVKVFSNDYYLILAGNQLWASPAKATLVGHESPPPIELTLAPAIRVFGSDPDYRRLRLQQLPETSYAGLPRKELLPLRLTERPPSPMIERAVETDADGRFEFFVGPGKYALLGPRDERLDYFPSFTLSDQKEFEVSLRNPPPSVRLKGRVVRSEDPQAGVADATIDLNSERGGSPPIRSNASGEFTASVSDDDFPLVVRAPGGLRGIAERRQGSNEIVIPVGPPAKVRGRLVNGSGTALRGSVDYSIVQEKRGNWSANSIARDSAELDDQGNFTLEVVPGWTYALWANPEKPGEPLPDGSPTILSFGRPVWLGTARSDAGEAVELGDVVIARPDVGTSDEFKSGAAAGQPPAPPAAQKRSAPPERDDRGAALPAPNSGKPLLGQTVDKQVRAYLEQRWQTGEPDRKFVTVRGKVVAAAGAPLADAEVTAEDAREYGTIAQTRSAANGEFELEVRAYLEGNLPSLLARDQDHKLIGMARPSANGEPVTITLAPAREVLTKVVDGQGQPVAGAVVTAFFANEFATSALTDAEGAASLDVLADERLEISFASKDGLGFDYALYDPNGTFGDQPLPEPGSPPLVFTLDGARPVSVKVINGMTRQPVVGALVRPYFISRADRRTMIMMHPDFAPEWKLTGDDGVAAFGYIAKSEGVAFLVSDRQGGLHSRRRDWWFYPDRDGHEPVVELWPKVALTGQVRFADGRPAPRLPVIVDGGAEPASETLHAETDEQGNFQVEVGPHDYYLVVAGNKEWATPSRALVVGHEPPPPLELTAQPAIRVFGSGSSVRELQLAQHPDTDYTELPRDQLLPLSQTEQGGPWPLLLRAAQVDAEGNFEFFVGPGKYTLQGPDDVKLEYTPHFVLTDQTALEVSLKRRDVTYPERKLRVVLRDDPSVIVPNASVAVAKRGRPGVESSRETSERTGEGTFVDTGADLTLKAVSADKALVGAADWNSGGGDAVIPIGSPGSIRGRIVDPSGAKLAGTVSFTTDFNGTEEQRWARMISGQYVKLDDEGRFVLDKLVPGVVYSLRADITYPFPGTPPTNSIYRRGWFRSQWLGPVKAKSGEPVDLGDMVIEP